MQNFNFSGPTSAFRPAATAMVAGGEASGRTRQNRVGVVAMCGLVWLAGYLFSTWFLYVYRWGDQEHYDRFWRALVWTDPSRWQDLQLQYLSSSEPLYRFIVGIGTYYDFDRITYLSAWNGILFSTIAYALIKLRSSIIFALFVFTNYYVLVLVGPAERLKFAYIFIIVAFCVNSPRLKVAFSAASLFSHTQAIAQFISSFAYYFVGNYKKLFKKRINIILSAIGIPVVLGILAYLVFSTSGDVLSSKSEHYGSESEGLLEIIQWLLILVVGTAVFDKRVQFFVGMLPMGVLTAFYGSRINVATLAFFCALALLQNKTAHPFVLAVMAYMSFKSIGFIANVLQTGQGF